MNTRTRVLRRLRRHRKPIALLAAAVLAGLGLIAAGVALGEHTEPGLFYRWPVEAAAAYATAGYAAESRGLIPARSWWRRPTVAAEALRSRMATPGRRNLYGRPTFEVDAADMVDCREPATVECTAGLACETHRPELVAALAAEEINLVIHAATPGSVCGAHLRPAVACEEVPDVAPAA